MMNRRPLIVIVALILMALATVQCTAQPETAAEPEQVVVEVTRIVEGESEIIEVTRQVEVEREVEVTRVVEVPQEALRIEVAYPSTIDFEDIPTLIAQDRLAEMGYNITPTFFAQPELAVEALASGDAHFGNGAERTFWAAAAQGAPIVTIIEQSANAWSIYSIPEISECSDLEGMRLAQHSEGAVSKAMTDAYIQENCPGTEPNVLIIPGSENRAAALLAGEIDATPVELADAVQIDLEAPDRFEILANFARDLPRLKTTGIYVNSNFAEENPQAVKDYLRTLLQVHREINEDPQILIDEAAKLLPIDAEVLPQIASAYQEIGAFDPNGGLTPENIQYSIDFYANAERLPQGLTTDDVADLSFLNEVLDEIGRQ